MENYFSRPEIISFQSQPLDFFVLSEAEKKHILTKQGFHNPLIYVILLKYFESERRFPERSIALLPYVHEMLVNLSNPLKAYSLTVHDKRALNPMFYGHLNPHGVVSLNMTKRLNFKILKPQKTKAV